MTNNPYAIDQTGKENTEGALRARLVSVTTALRSILFAAGSGTPGYAEALFVLARDGAGMPDPTDDPIPTAHPSDGAGMPHPTDPTTHPPVFPCRAPELSLRELQTSLPWTIRYSEDFRADRRSHKDFAHAMHHVAKAAGQLHTLVDDMDHDRNVADDHKLRDTYGKYVADLVVCALRLANTFPSGVLDLQREVVDRIETKNSLKLSGK